MVAPQPAPDSSGWNVAMDHWAEAAAASRTASRVLAGDLSLLEALPELHALLTKLGEFDRGEYVGDMAALSLMLLELEPYVLPGGKISEHAIRWAPTLLARHRPAALEACRRVVERYGPVTRSSAPV